MCLMGMADLHSGLKAGLGAGTADDVAMGVAGLFRAESWRSGSRPMTAYDAAGHVVWQQHLGASA